MLTIFDTISGSFKSNLFLIVGSISDILLIKFDASSFIFFKKSLFFSITSLILLKFLSINFVSDNIEII